MFKFIRQYRHSFSTLVKQFAIGEYPTNLAVDRHFGNFEESILENGIHVCTEYWPSSLAHFYSLTVFIKCGSRNETEETSGAAHFLEHLNFKGTGKRTRDQLELEVENIGAQLNAYTSRENTSFTINCFKQNLRQSVDIVGDQLSNSLYSKRDLEIERDTIYRELLETRKMQFETTIEISHRGCYKNHQMALPILGKISNMYSIDRDMVVKFHQANYYGQNLIVVGCGDIKHQDLCKYVLEAFSKLPKKPELLQPVSPKPKFQEEIFLMESELTDGLNIAIFNEAPPWNHPMYYHFLILQRLLADKSENPMEAQILLNTNLNSFQKQLHGFQTIQTQKSVYTPYMDTGIFGNYYMATHEGLDNAIIVGKYAQNINEEELQRAKRRLFIELGQHETGNDMTQAIGNQILYFNRRIYRQEIAQNIANLSSKDIQNAIKEYLIYKPVSVTLWGNIKPIIEKYNIPKDKLGTH